jgi:hypothetical protein
LFDIGDWVRAFSCQEFPKRGWHGPRSHVNHVLPIKTADQVPAEVVQIAVEDGGNPRPLFVVAKNLAVANYGDNLARLNNRLKQLEDKIAPKGRHFVFTHFVYEEPDAHSRDERLAAFKADHGVTPSDIIHEVRVAFS